VRDALADLVYNACTIRAADVECASVVLFLVEPDDVDRRAQSGPDAVVVDAGCHHQHQALVAPNRRGGDGFDLECVDGLTEAILSKDMRIHEPRNLSQRWDLAYRIDISCHSTSFQ